MTARQPSPMKSRIEATVLRIADDLRSKRHQLHPAAGFASGAVGGALFFAHANRALPQRGFDEDAHDLLKKTIDALDGAAAHGWINGFPSAAWAANLATGLLPQAGMAIALEEHDARLLEVLDAGAIEETAYDPLKGWGGVLLYAAQRKDSELGGQIGALAYHRLLDSSRKDGDGAYWFESPEHFAPAAVREFGDARVRQYMQAALAQHPDGRANTAVAHGNAGVIGCLAAALHAQCVPPEAAHLLNDACNWLLAQKLGEAGRRSLFPSFKGEPYEVRHAWCYGDPGICLQLFHAGKVLSRPDLTAAAREVALLATRREAREGQVNDAGLCHGSAGLARIFARAADYTDASAMQASAQQWIEYTLSLEQPAGAPAPFLFWVAENLAEPAVGLLEGTAGVGLALLAAIDDKPIEWDRAMLMSI